MHWRWARTLAAAMTAWQFAVAQPRVDTFATLRGNGDDVAGAMTVDAAGNVYLVGHTTSFNIIAGTLDSGQKLRITVADTSIGIPSRSRAVDGTGLRLSIIKHSVERMDGSVPRS